MNSATNKATETTTIDNVKAGDEIRVLVMGYVNGVFPRKMTGAYRTSCVTKVERFATAAPFVSVKDAEGLSLYVRWCDVAVGFVFGAFDQDQTREAMAAAL